MISEAMQDYLKTIYTLQQKEGVVSTSALAESLGVTAPSATSMVKKLARMKYLRHNRYQGVLLTKSGERAALEVIRHHRLLELYLAEALGYSWDMVHAEAERLEHVISEEFADRIFQALGQPTRDPHGHPIPTKDGKLVGSDGSPLSEVPAGEEGVIALVSDRDPAMLRYLGDRGLIPGATVAVVAKDPFKGPITVRTQAAAHTLGIDLARQILVQVHRKGAA